MKKKLKKYYPDLLILGGILLFITNYFFKLTEYEEGKILAEGFQWKETGTVYIQPTYDYIGFIASIIIIIGLFVIVRTYILKRIK